jgi:hypothetical protein
MDQPNLTYIEKLSNGDKIFSKKLIDTIKFELPSEKELYHNNIISKNFKNKHFKF